MPDCYWIIDHIKQHHYCYIFPFLRSYFKYLFVTVICVQFKTLKFLLCCWSLQISSSLIVLCSCPGRKLKYPPLLVGYQQLFAFPPFLALSPLTIRSSAKGISRLYTYPWWVTDWLTATLKFEHKEMTLETCGPSDFWSEWCLDKRQNSCDVFFFWR